MPTILFWHQSQDGTSMYFGYLSYKNSQGKLLVRKHKNSDNQKSISEKSEGSECTLGGFHIWRTQYVVIFWPLSLFVCKTFTVCPQIWGISWPPSPLLLGRYIWKPPYSFRGEARPLSTFENNVRRTDEGRERNGLRRTKRTTRKEGEKVLWLSGRL